MERDFGMFSETLNACTDENRLIRALLTLRAWGVLGDGRGDLALSVCCTRQYGKALGLLLKWQYQPSAKHLMTFVGGRNPPYIPTVRAMLKLVGARHQGCTVSRAHGARDALEAAACAGHSSCASILLRAGFRPLTRHRASKLRPSIVAIMQSRRRTVRKLETIYERILKKGEYAAFPELPGLIIEFIL